MRIANALKCKLTTKFLECTEMQTNNEMQPNNKISWDLFNNNKYLKISIKHLKTIYGFVILQAITIYYLLKFDLTLKFVRCSYVSELENNEISNCLILLINCSQ